MKVNDAEAPVSQALILICEKCGKKVATDFEHNPSRDLQAALKEEIKARGDKGVIRAVVTSCMDICPKDEIAIAISRSQQAGGQDRFYTIQGGDVQKQRDAILELAKK